MAENRPAFPPYGAVTPPLWGTGFEAAGAAAGGTTPPGLPPAGRTPPGLPPAGTTPPGLPPAGRTPPLAGARAISANPNTILSRKVLDTYFNTFDYPFTRHHIDSFDQFVSQDLPAILKANNPILVLKGPNEETANIAYKAEVYVGGLSGSEIEIGTPTVSLQRAQEVRVLFPNEARLRNLTYSSTVYVNVFVKITITMPGAAESLSPITKQYTRMPLFKLPILLHSRFCILHSKPASFLSEAGECPQDHGGYFIIEGTEKVLITRQEQAFNVLYCLQQPADPKIATYGNITCLSPATRQVKVVSFYWNRQTDSLQVSLPFVRKPVPLFVLFRAMGIQADEDILKLIYPDLTGSEAKQMVPLLLPSIAESFPFLDQYSAIQFIKAMTKGFSEFHVYDILMNQTFIHITDNRGGSRAHFLAECVRQFMRVHTGIDPKTDRDDTRNQRCLTSGFLVRMLFNGAYTSWKKAVRLAISTEYQYGVSTYTGIKFANIFSDGNTQKLFNLNLITEGLMRGFKGKWVTGGGGGGGSLGHSDEKSGVLQSLSRLSYLDFMSHCRRVNLNFDTGMKITGPRQLHSSQYGYFCTHETPGGASIGITKNLSLMTLMSTASNPDPLVRWMMQRGWLIPCAEMRPDLMLLAVGVYVNNGIVGYTLQPFELTDVLKHMKWTACLPALASVGFSIRNRRVFVFMDEGRPCRPVIRISGGTLRGYPKDVLEVARSWRSLVCGTLEATAANGISTTGFFDPLGELEGPVPLEDYKARLVPHVGVIEYVDPYESNEMLLASFPEHINEETTHCEIHPSTILSIVNGMVPFANYNQAPRNQLSCSQSKQALGYYATNFQNRYDGAVNILCYGEAPLVRTFAYDKLGNGLMPYGTNLMVAIMPFHGFNRDDGIIFNLDSFQRGMFRSIHYRSYECCELVDPISKAKSVIANPLRVSSWLDLRPGLDYTKLDERGIIKVGELVDENTVLVGRYTTDKEGHTKDSSLTPQVWTSGRVESVVVTMDNRGFMIVKVRITQDRVPELGDKFSSRHGQKGTMGMGYRAHDMPRTASGVVPDMIVNPHCIPSRMTIAQLLEMLFGKVCLENTIIGDATTFTSDENAAEAIGRVLEGQFGLERAGNELLYDGESGRQVPTMIFMGPFYGMRLKHMVEDKWNARAEGRREQRTHQPTGGRGAQGGLRCGEMERDGLVAHGVSGFLRESLMERSDKTTFRICNGCGTVPIYNDQQRLFVCPLCDGPVRFIGNTANNLEILPTVEKSLVTSSLIEIPYATKLLAEELQTYMNMGLRFLTTKGVDQMRQPPELEVVATDAIAAALREPLGERVMPETRIPEYREPPPEEAPEATEEDLIALGIVRPGGGGATEEDFEDAEEAAIADGAGPAPEPKAGWTAEQWRAAGYTPPKKAYESKAEWVAAGYPDTPPYGAAPAAAAGPLGGALVGQPRQGLPAFSTYDPRTGIFMNESGGQWLGNRAAYVPQTPPGGPSPIAAAAAAPARYPVLNGTVYYNEGDGQYYNVPVGGNPVNVYNQSAITPPGVPAGLAVPTASAPLAATALPGPSPASRVMMGGASHFNHSGYPGTEPIIFGPPVPNAPPTIVINTNHDAMRDAGYAEEEYMAAGGQATMGRQSRLHNHKTPRARQGSPRPSRGPPTIGGSAAPHGAKLIINKLG